MRTGDTQSVPANTPNIYVEIQTPSPEDVSSKVVEFRLDEQLYGGVYEIWLDNSDSALAAKDYVGYKVDLELGFSGGTRSQFPDLWVDTQEFESSPGKLRMKLTCIDAWGLLAKVNVSVGAQYWNYPELAPGEPDADATYYDKTIEQIVASIIQSALNTTFDVDDDDSEAYFNSLKPPIRVNNARTGIFQLMSMTGAYLLYRNDEDFHAIKPSDHASVYTFALGDDEFWIDSEQSAVTIPNRVIFHGTDSSENLISSGDSGKDSTSYSRIGIYIDEHYYAGRTEINLITSQTLLDNLAAATMAKLQGERSQGTLIAPMHCSLELLDKITITDTRYSGTKTITGYVHRIIREYVANKGIYRINITLGGVSSGYTPSGGVPIVRKSLDSEPTPLGQMPVPAPALLPIVLDIDFSATDNDDVTWGAGTIKAASGETFTINSGSLNLANSNPYYLYYDTDVDDGDLDNTQTFVDTVSHEKLLVAFLKKAPQTNQKALIVPAKGGSSPTFNQDVISANCITASEIYVANLAAIVADMGLLTAGEIRVGTGTLGTDFTGWRLWLESGIGRIAGYNADTMQWYSDTDGKLYAGGGTVALDAASGIIITGQHLVFKDSTNYGYIHQTGTILQILAGGGSTLQLRAGKIDAASLSGYGITIKAGGVGTTPTANDLRLEAIADIFLKATAGFSLRAGGTPASPGQDDVSIVADNDLILRGGFGQAGNVNIYAGIEGSYLGYVNIIAYDNGTGYSRIFMDGTGDIEIDPEGNDVIPGETGVDDLGTATDYWDKISYKILSDEGCPAPIFKNPITILRNMGTRKRRITIADAIDEAMGKRARRMVEEAGGELDIEEWDKDTFPEQILNIPTKEDREKGLAVYNRRLRQYNSGECSKIPHFVEPHKGVITNELVWLLVRATQELADKVEALEKGES